ncbi:ectoine/hydroxyectoine ABC transporter permease subunit EhuC [Paenibacillus sambharensis]
MMDVPWNDFYPLLWEGLKVTVEVAVLSALAALVLSLVIGLCRVSKFKTVRIISQICTEVFRGLPLLVLLFWVYFALPFLGVEFDKVTSAVVAIGLNYGAFGSEIVRSAILAVPNGQSEAARALNFSPLQRMIYIILPQAALRMLPPFGNLMIELIKGTSLIYFITLSDLTYQALILRNNFLSMTPYIFLLLLLIYFVLSSFVSVTVRLLERKLAAGRL